MTRHIRLQNPAIALSRAVLALLAMGTDFLAAGAVSRTARNRYRAAAGR